MNNYAIDEEFLQRLEMLQTLPKKNIAGMFGGNHQSKSFGSSCDFTDYRSYLAGDDITKIDWNAFARFDELYLRLYQDERQLHTRIYIDASRSMSFDNHGGKAELAIKIAAAFAYLSVAELDKVSIYYIRNNEVHEVIKGMVGKENFYHEIFKLNDIQFEGDCFISDAVLPTKVGYGDGLSIVISDFLTDADYESAIDYMVDKHRDLLCVQVLTSEEINPKLRGKNHLFDSEHPNDYYRKNINRDIVQAYRMAVKYVQDRLSNYCQSRGSHYLLVSDDMPVDQIFFNLLTEQEVLK